MNIILINTDPMVQKLIEASAKRSGVKLIHFKNLGELDSSLITNESFFFIDEGVLSDYEKDSLKELIKDKTSCLIYSKNKSNETFSFSIRKPFLPTQVLDLIKAELTKLGHDLENAGEHTLEDLASVNDVGDLEMESMQGVKKEPKAAEEPAEELDFLDDDDIVNDDLNSLKSIDFNLDSVANEAANIKHDEEDNLAANDSIGADDVVAENLDNLDSGDMEDINLDSMENESPESSPESSDEALKEEANEELEGLEGLDDLDSALENVNKTETLESNQDEMLDSLESRMEDGNESKKQELDDNLDLGMDLENLDSSGEKESENLDSLNESLDDLDLGDDLADKSAESSGEDNAPSVLDSNEIDEVKQLLDENEKANQNNEIELVDDVDFGNLEDETKDEEKAESIDELGELGGEIGEEVADKTDSSKDEDLEIQLDLADLEPDENTESSEEVSKEAQASEESNETTDDLADLGDLANELEETENTESKEENEALDSESLDEPLIDEALTDDENIEGLDNLDELDNGNQEEILDSLKDSKEENEKEALNDAQATLEEESSSAESIQADMQADFANLDEVEVGSVLGETIVLDTPKNSELDKELNDEELNINEPLKEDSISTESSLEDIALNSLIESKKESTPSNRKSLLADLLANKTADEIREILSGAEITINIKM